MSQINKIRPIKESAQDMLKRKKKDSMHKNDIREEKRQKTENDAKINYMSFFHRLQPLDGLLRPGCDPFQDPTRFPSF